MSGIRSSLGAHAASMRDPDPALARAAARDAFTRSGGEIVLINKNWLDSWIDRKQLDLLAEKALDVKGTE